MNPTQKQPTEAEIQEAAEIALLNELWDVNRPFDSGFKLAITWLQNYQTHGSEKPVISDNATYLINRLKHRLQSQDEVQTSWVIKHLDEILNQSGASQPNPAITDGSQWVSVNDGMPELGKKVIVHFGDIDNQLMAIPKCTNEYETVFCVYYADRFTTEHAEAITHWRYVDSPGQSSLITNDKAIGVIDKRVTELNDKKQKALDIRYFQTASLIDVQINEAINLKQTILKQIKP